MLKPQDIVLLLKIFSALQQPKDSREGLLSQNKLATYLCMSASEVNAGFKRLASSGLLCPVISDNAKTKSVFMPNRRACEECLVSGVKYFFPAELGSYTRGIATSYAAPVLAEHFILGDDPIPVWPDGVGDNRGIALEPLYRSVPESLSKFPDSFFYELLALVDAIRSGRARERKLAAEILKEKLYEKRDAAASKSKLR